MSIFGFINPQIFIGLGFSMHIEAAVEYLKQNWKLSSQLAPYVASVLSFIVQFGIVSLYHLPVDQAIVGTIFTTAGACFWHEVSSPSK